MEASSGSELKALKGPPQCLRLSLQLTSGSIETI